METILGLCWNPGRMTLDCMRRCLCCFGDKGYPERVTVELILEYSGATYRNVKIMLPPTPKHHYEGWRGSREASCEALCGHHVPTCLLWCLFCRHFSIWILNGGPLGAPGGHIWDTSELVSSEIGFQMFWGVNFGKGRQNGRGSPTACLFMVLLDFWCPAGVDMS